MTSNQPTWVMTLRKLFALQFSLKDFFEFFNLWPDYNRAIRLGAMQTKVVLVVIFRRIKGRKFRNLGNDGFAVCFALIELILIMLCLLALFLIMVENSTAILRSHIISLPVQAGRIMGFPKYFQQFVKAYRFGII